MRLTRSESPLVPLALSSSSRAGGCGDWGLGTSSQLASQLMTAQSRDTGGGARICHLAFSLGLWNLGLGDSGMGFQATATVSPVGGDIPGDLGAPTAGVVRGSLGRERQR